MLMRHRFRSPSRLLSLGLLPGLLSALLAVRLHPQDRSRPAEAGPRDVPPEVPDEA